VYADGSICLDILQNRWSPTYDVSAILTSIQVFAFFLLLVDVHVTFCCHGSCIACEATHVHRLCECVIKWTSVGFFSDKKKPFISWV